MARPEQIEKHPEWLIAIDPPTTLPGRLTAESRFRRRTLRQQHQMKHNLQRSLESKHPGFREQISDFFVDDIREVKFRESVTEYLKGRKGLNVLVVNHGNPFHDIDLPLEIAERSDSQQPGKIDFLGIPPLFNSESIAECNEIFKGACTFSEITEDQFNAKRGDSGYDLILVYRDSTASDGEEQEGIHDVPRYSSPFWANKFAEQLVAALKPGASIIASADESVDLVRHYLVDITQNRPGFRSKPYQETTFVNLQTDTPYVPKAIRNNRVALAINHEDPDKPRTVKRDWRSWRRKALTVGIPAFAVAAGAFIATSSTGSSPDHSAQPLALHCSDDEIPVNPTEIYSSGPKQITIIFEPPGEPKLTIVDNNNQLTFSQPFWGVSRPIPARVGGTYALPGGSVVHVGKTALLDCEAPKPSGKPSTTKTNSINHTPGAP